MKIKKSLSLGIIFSLAFLFAISLVAGANNIAVITPESGSNHSTSASPSFNCSTDGTAVVTDIINATFFYNPGGTLTVIGTVTNTSEDLNASISGTLALSGLTKGTAYTISCEICNPGDCNSTDVNTSGVGIYTDAPSCSFMEDTTSVDWMSYLGVNPSDFSTCDSITSLSYLWTLWDSENSAVTTDTSSAPSFTNSDFSEKGEYTLGLTVTDLFGNSSTCSNVTIFVSGKDGGQTTVGQSILSGESDTLFWVLGVIGILVLIAIVSFFIISYSKRR